MLIASPQRAVPPIVERGGPGNLKVLPVIGWGAGAAAMFGLAVMAAQTEVGAQRGRTAVLSMLSATPSPDQRAEQQLSSQMTAWSQGVEKQFRRQSEIIQSLTEQRDTLADKVAVIDRQLGDLTAAVSRATARLDNESRMAQPAASRGTAAAAKSDLPEATPTAAAASPAPATPPRGQIVPHAAAGQPNPLPPGQIAPPSAATLATLPGFSIDPATTGALPPPVNFTPEVIAAMMTPRPFPTPAAHPEPAKPAAGRQTRAAAALPMFQGNPLMTSGILDSPGEASVLSQEFAIDLGGAATVEALRTRWNEVRTSQSPLFDNLKPLVALKDSSKPGQELHLVAGPLNSAGATARLCAVLSGSSVPCVSTTYEGQRLAVR